ncbi:hypothetical protein V6N13_001306 [Hibiscus sabdariffa]
MQNPNSLLWHKLKASPAVNGLISSNQVGHPPDEVVIVDVSAALERQGSSVSRAFQPVLKKGRSVEQTMMVEDTPMEAMQDASGRTGGSTPVMVQSNKTGSVYR